jgi:hypothetical protein
MSEIGVLLFNAESEELDFAKTAVGDSHSKEISTKALVSAWRSSTPNLASDLLPSQRGAIKPDSHSIFNPEPLDVPEAIGSKKMEGRAKVYKVAPLVNIEKSVSCSFCQFLYRICMTAIPQDLLRELRACTPELPEGEILYLERSLPPWVWLNFEAPPESMANPSAQQLSKREVQICTCGQC